MSTFVVGKCKECGKLLKATDEYMSFNGGKFYRCKECCDKIGIKKIKFYGFKKESVPYYSFLKGGR